jgi:excisionase family DNA binding protein
MGKNFYTTHEVSKFCNVYPTTVINWIKEGKLPAYTTPGGHRRIKKEDLLELMRKNSMPIPDNLIKDENHVVLVIDDDTKILQMIKTVLSQEEGLQIITAESGFVAGLTIYSNMPDLILLDFLMPNMNGFEVCRRLKSGEKTKDIPIIAITALKEPEEIKKMFSAGIVDLVSKPFKSEELLKKVKEHLLIETK